MLKFRKKNTLESFLENSSPLVNPCSNFSKFVIKILCFINQTHRINNWTQFETTFGLSTQKECSWESYLPSRFVNDEAESSKTSINVDIKWKRQFERWKKSVSTVADFLNFRKMTLPVTLRTDWINFYQFCDKTNSLN